MLYMCGSNKFLARPKISNLDELTTKTMAPKICCPKPMRLCYPLKKLAQASQMSRKIAVVVFLKTNRCRQERLELSEKNHRTSLCFFGGRPRHPGKTRERSRALHGSLEKISKLPRQEPHGKLLLQGFQVFRSKMKKNFTRQEDSSHVTL